MASSRMQHLNNFGLSPVQKYILKLKYLPP
jgi:hypothetical protein